jgi:predicted ATPase/class 3 adenylate cyclase
LTVEGLPTGTVTFLFTDLEGSTRLWEADPDGMATALSRHDEVVRGAIEANGGHVVKTTGDGVLAAFPRAPQAVLAAVQAQRGLAAETWSTSASLRVRMGVHTGEVDLVDGDYHGPPLNRAARLMSVALGGQILLSQVSQALAADHLEVGLEMVDLGEHHLRDLSRPERVFQVIGEGLVAPVGELRTLDAFPTNLPVQVTSFVGRDVEIERIVTAFSEVRLVTITGVGGVGKTRLAMQLAAELLPRFAQGSWLCELAAASDADTMHAVVAATLHVKPRTGSAMDTAILEALRDKALLVVLDNCEHLLSAAGALADGLLRHCPGVSVLATSREGLGIDGEQVWPLRSLEVPEESNGVGSGTRSDAVRLFADRARAARPGFALDETNVASVAEICRRLDGIPLAIELAAARVAAMSPSEIGRLLDERFRLLTGGRRTAVERHQTLRATVDWSYSLLKPVERLVFDRLAMFAGTFDADSATVVVSSDGVEPWDVRDSLMALVAKSLVAAEPTSDDQTRYSMLETLRQYGREQLDENGGTDTWRRRHAAHFAEFAEVAGPALLGSEELPWRRRVGLELDNLRAAVTWSLDSHDHEDRDYAIRIIAALAFEATMRRSSGLARWAEDALAFVGGTTPGRRAAIYGTAAYGSTFRGDYETAGRLAELSLREEITPDFPAPNQGVVVACMAQVSSGNPAGAVAQALAYAERFDALGVRVFDRSNIRVTAAIWALFCDDVDTAKREAQMALELARQIDNPSSLAMASCALGWALALEDPKTAASHLERSIALTRSGASDVVLSTSLTRLATIKARRGEADALPVLHEALRHAHDDGDAGQVAGTLDRAAVVLAELGRNEAAATVTGGVLDGAAAAMVLATPTEVIERDEASQRLRAELGVDRYEDAFARGGTMSFDELVGFALEALEGDS